MIEYFLFSHFKLLQQQKPSHQQVSCFHFQLCFTRFLLIFLFIIIAQMSIPLCQAATWNSTYIQIAGATSYAGSTQYLLSSPYDVAVDVYQNTYVVDYNNHRIQRFQLGV